jgi:hypothetical protein
MKEIVSQHQYDLGCPVAKRPCYKDSQGRLSYRLCDYMVGSTMGFVF